MHDLFGVVDDPVTEAAKVLAGHDLFVLPGSIMRECLTVLHILACDADDTEERALTLDLIAGIESAWERSTGIRVGGGGMLKGMAECNQ